VKLLCALRKDKQVQNLKDSCGVEKEQDDEPWFALVCPSTVQRKCLPDGAPDDERNNESKQPWFFSQQTLILIHTSSIS
jgi:hypothetical protein